MSLHISPFSVATNALVLSLAGIASAQNLGGLDTPPQAKTDTTKATENTSSILIKTEENSQDTTNEKPLNQIPLPRRPLPRRPLPRRPLQHQKLQKQSLRIKSKLHK